VACYIDIRGKDMVMGYWNSQSELGIREKWMKPRRVTGNTMLWKGQLFWDKEGGISVPEGYRS
jgi:hypothetical protein